MNSVAAAEHLVADELGGAARAPVAAAVVRENGVADALLLVVTGVPLGAGDRAVAVVAVTVVVEIPAPGIGGRLVGQYSEGSNKE